MLCNAFQIQLDSMSENMWMRLCFDMHLKSNWILWARIWEWQHALTWIFNPIGVWDKTFCHLPTENENENMLWHAFEIHLDSMLNRSVIYLQNMRMKYLYAFKMRLNPCGVCDKQWHKLTANENGNMHGHAFETHVIQESEINCSVTCPQNIWKRICFDMHLNPCGVLW